MACWEIVRYITQRLYDYQSLIPSMAVTAERDSERIIAPPIDMMHFTRSHAPTEGTECACVGLCIVWTVEAKRFPVYVSECPSTKLPTVYAFPQMEHVFASLRQDSSYSGYAAIITVFRFSEWKRFQISIMYSSFCICKKTMIVSTSFTSLYAFALRS